MKSWFVLHSDAGSAAENMALDEALMEAMPRLGQPVLRFYSWREPAASFGYFQKFAEVSRITLLRPLVRRPTGGGIVPHDTDWTYSLAFPADQEWHSLRAAESYRRVHQWIQTAFERLNIPTRLAEQSKKTEAGQCFAGHEISDVLWRGKKIAGAAQRRTRHGLLIQGSVQPPSVPVSRMDWEKAMLLSREGEYPDEWTGMTLDESLRQNIARLMREKYTQPAYNEKR